MKKLAAPHFESLRSYRLPSVGAMIGALTMFVSLSACSTVGDIAATAQTDTYSVTAKATGTRLAWANAHQKAVESANAYCKARNQLASIKSESTGGIRSLEEQSATVQFVCNPQPFASAQN
jgi:hypothetical protein